jgi:uncharacterized protein
VSVRYNVSTLLKEPVGSTREHEVDGHVLIDDAEPQLHRVTGSATFLRTKDAVLVTAQLGGVQPERCSRCLREMDMPVWFEIEEEFFASVDGSMGAVLTAPEDTEAFRIDAQHVLDLEEAVRQSWAAALPMQPLCRPDCRGLCPRCGQDLNQGACSCPAEEDERWSPLRKLVREEKGK